MMRPRPHAHLAAHETHQLLAEIIARWSEIRRQLPARALLIVIAELVDLLRLYRPDEVSAAEWTRWLDGLDRVITSQNSPKRRLDAVGRLLFVGDLAAALRGAS